MILHLKLFSSDLSIDDFEGLYESLKQAEELNQEIDDNINATNIDFKDAPGILSIFIKLVLIILNLIVGSPFLIIINFYWIYQLGKDIMTLNNIIQNGMDDLGHVYEQVEKNKELIQNRKEVLYKKITKLLEKQNNKTIEYNDITTKLTLV